MKFRWIKFGGLLGVLLFLNVGLGLADDQSALYDTLKSKGLQAIADRKPFPLKFTHPARYDITQMKYDANQTGIFIDSYTPKGKLVNQSYVGLDEFEALLDYYQQGSFKISKHN